MRSPLARLLAPDALLALAALLLYGWLAPVYVLGGDNAEFVTLGRLGGVAHPSGYPLYVLWLRATSWIPATSAAQSAALATALLAALQIFVLCAACRAWGAGPTAAAFACAIYAASPIALELFSQAEVFALHGLLAAAILWLSAPQAPIRGRPRVVLLGFFAGLALSNQLTAALLLPVGAVAVVCGLRDADAPARMRFALLAAAAFALGLAPYVYLLVAPTGGISWGVFHGLADVARHALRADYGTLTLTPHGVGASPWRNVAALIASLSRAWWWIGGALGGLTAVAMSVRSGARAAWLGLLATLLTTGPALVWLFNVDSTGMGAWIARRFHLLPSMLLTIPVAVGLQRVASRARGPDRGAGWARALPIAALVIAAAPSLDSVGRAHSPAVERYADNLLRIAPKDAVLLLGGDHVTFGLAHAQLVLGRRPDVIHVAWDLMSLPWYRRRVSERLGFEAVPPGDGPASVRLAEAILAHGRPLLVDPAQGRILAALPTYPFGPMIRVLPRDARTPAPTEALTLNRQILARLDLRYPRPERGDGWAAVVHESYALPWRSLAGALTRAARPTEAAEAAEIAARLAPR